MLECVTIDGLLSNKCARALLGFQNAADFQFALGAHYGVGIDRQVHRHLTDSRKLDARGQRSRCQRAGHLIDELPVNGYAAIRIQAEAESGAVARGAHLES